MVIAAGSYPAGRWFESDRRYHNTHNRPLGQAVKTSPFHGGNMGSSPVGVTKQVKGEPVSIRRRIRLYRCIDNHSLNEWVKRLKLWTKKYSYGKLEATDNRKRIKPKEVVQ